MLSVHGKRGDGFHALTSLVVALEFGDTLTIRPSDSADVLRCSDAAVPLGPENLVLKAAAAFRARLEREVFFEFDLDKRIPMGAGLGGGSGNAAVALRGMNELLGEPFTNEILCEIAAELGSDCPFFIEGVPAWMRGRGEVIEPLAAGLAERLRGTRLVLFRPDFGVETAWAYGRLVAGAPQTYETEAAGVARLERFVENGDLGDVLYNSFEAPVGSKYLAISTLLANLREQGVACLMSGSGSCCFALLEKEGVSAEEIGRFVRDAWGEGVFWVETSIC
ncbi:4-diphosphocytidyl-2-C-methyl-D-erythritol kinase (EC [Lentimonas sp. CC4]|nr:4-diphosphocytidyl-2-C-methyl-D-erythritol kinase (EC [Lentimonas sp. CC4]CAA6687232.1 4-diphosphocytidyl-2-C-methyl-D-erythritol kinase (EC [Lentimonas sp. CC6]CAA7074367.1 4-diphosphocytidyl-2-C-methyl-D-erythritol kinase (EC [Lentimonas sp. CC4]CAA7171464.1 4-diphosphocytidyl-2-C-methyl-D-erythritol kinase (EC [Lentimonas sp. CC21]CAA7180040.1 4-diphosphocytidyl-2-C-methyl-D-erythritol kinase (EC [Lentimonas sp. CC8]